MRRAVLVAAALTAVALPATAGAKTYRGRIEIRHSDDFKHERTHTRYRLVRRHGRSIALAPRIAPRTPSGSEVLVHGRRGAVIGRGVRASTVTPGARRTAVILVNFTSDTSTPWTPDYVRGRVFTDSSSTSAFYEEESYGDISLTGNLRADGDVFGWYTVDPLTSGCGVSTLAQQARAAAVAGGFDSTAYDHIVYVFPYQASCAWAGLGEVPGRQSWMNGTVATRVVAHELGHNMGLHHASSLSCSSGGAPVAYSPSCTPDEYGDPYDVMGLSLWHNNAWHLRQIGFMAGSNVQVASSGTYTIATAATRGAATQLLRVPIAGSSPQKYYDLELRTAAGVFDDFLSTDPAVNGVMIHVDPEPAVIKQSLLIDTTPGSPNGFDDAALAAGRTFSDGSVSITVDSIAAGVATVEVSGGPPPADTAPPSAPAGLTATPAADSVTLSWQPSTDNVGVTGYRVYRGGVVFTTTAETSWTDHAVSPGGSYLYRVAAYDAAGNAAPSANVGATVPGSPVSPPPTVQPPALDPPPAGDPGPTRLPPPDFGLDGIAPTVRILAPGKRVRQRTRRVLVKALATDNVAVARTEIYLDSVLARVVQGPRVSWRWPLRRVRRGRHIVLVRAYDAHGNRAQAVRRVRVVR